MEDYYSSDNSDVDPSSATTLDLSHLAMVTSGLQQHLEFLLDTKKNVTDCIDTVLLFSNNILNLPPTLLQFPSLKVLDLSSNNLSNIPHVLTQLSLSTLILKHNHLNLDSFPKTFGNLESSLKSLNLSGNDLKGIPEQILEFKQLKRLYLGSNAISEIPRAIKKLISLQILYLGGNNVSEVPAFVGELTSLTSLVLCDNQIESLPSSIANLKSLRSLSLHRNRLRTLPQEIIALKGLTELSLRENPLVVRFVRDMTHQPPASLLELAARAVKIHQVPYGPKDLPASLREYLGSAHHCVNPQCQGVFFDNRVEHIKFVDFCGKYRVPLLQYLCSELCADNELPGHREEEESPPGSDMLMRKVLLG